MAGEFQANLVDTGKEKEVALAMDATGNFVMVWEGKDDSGGGIFLQRYDANGFALDLPLHRLKGRKLNHSCRRRFH